MEERAPELAVGDALQPEIFLKPDDLAYRAILGFAKLRSRDDTLLKSIAGIQQFCGAEDAADVICSKWRGGASWAVSYSLRGYRRWTDFPVSPRVAR